jgi:hypothetical protein
MATSIRMSRLVIQELLNGCALMTYHALLQIDMCLAFGETELTARLRWMEKVSLLSDRGASFVLTSTKGKYKYGKATIAHRSLAPEVG